MNHPINIERSIVWKRLVYKYSLPAIFSMLYDYFWGVLTLVFCCYIFVVQARDDNHLSVVALLCSGIAIGYLICCFIFLNRLIKIQGVSAPINRSRIIELVKEKYPTMLIEPGDRVVLATDRPKRLIQFDRNIAILIDGPDLYVTAYTLTRGNVKFMFMTVPNYLLCKRLAKEFGLMIG